MMGGSRKKRGSIIAGFRESMNECSLGNLDDIGIGIFARTVFGATELAALSELVGRKIEVIEVIEMLIDL